MVLSPNYIIKPYFCLAIILCLATITLGYPSEESILNLKIGFDLTQGSNGMPSLKIRKFESGEYNPRAESSEKDEKKHTTPKAAVRADSLSSSSEEDRKDVKEDLSFESSKQKSDEASANDSGSQKSRVTRGGGFDPEEDSNRPSYNDPSDSEGSRRKRSLKKMRKLFKKKGNKSVNGRKLGISKI